MPRAKAGRTMKDIKTLSVMQRRILYASLIIGFILTVILILS